MPKTENTTSKMPKHTRYVISKCNKPARWERSYFGHILKALVAAQPGEGFQVLAPYDDQGSVADRIRSAIDYHLIQREEMKLFYSITRISEQAVWVERRERSKFLKQSL